MRVPLFQWNMDFHHWNHLYMGNIWGWNFNFFCGNGSWGYSDELFFSPNPLHCDSIKGYIPTDRPHRRRVKYGLDYFWDHFFGQKNGPKNSPSIFYPMPRVRFFFRFNTADNNNSLDVIATYWERWARRYVFPSLWCWCEFSLDGRSAILMAQCSRISPSKSTTGVNVLFV